MKLWTIGHSNRSLEDFMDVLVDSEIQAVADVRRFPSSRKFPHFNGRSLQISLGERGIHYVWFEALGGRRHKERNEASPNSGLESAGFRNYADYMMTKVFNRTVDQLLSLASRRRTAIMCAERFFWKCHRRLLSDYLTARGVQVDHVIDRGHVRSHRLSDYAVVTSDGTVIYPAERRDEPSS